MPKQNKRRRGRSRKRSKYDNRNQVRFFASAVCIMVVVIFATIYYISNREPVARLDSEVQSIAQASNDEDVVDSKSTDQLLNLVEQIREQLKGQEKPAQVDSIKRLLEIADVLEGRAPVGDIVPQKVSQQLKLRNLFLLEQLNRENNPNAPDLDLPLRQFAETLTNSEDPEISALATNCLTHSSLAEYLRRPTPESLEQFEKYAGQMLENHLDKYPLMYELSEMIKSISLVGGDGTAVVNEKILSRYGKAMYESSVPGVRMLGGKLHNLILVGGTDIREMLFQISLGDEQGIKKGKKFIADLDTSAEYTDELFFYAIKIVDYLLRFERNQEADEALDQIESAARMQHPAVLASVERMVQRLNQRKELIGKPFELKATDTDKSEIDFSQLEGRPVVVVYFELDQESIDLMSAVREMNNLYENGLRFVCVATKPTTNQVITGINNLDEFYGRAASLYYEMKRTIPHAVFVPVSGNKAFLEQCPIHASPYILLLDKQHQVVERNIRLESLRELIQRHGF